MNEIEGITLLWTDQQDADIDLKNWLEKNSIFLIPIPSVFSNTKAMSTYNYFRASLNSIPSNYGYEDVGDISLAIQSYTL